MDLRQDRIEKAVAEMKSLLKRNVAYEGYLNPNYPTHIQQHMADQGIYHSVHLSFEEVLEVIKRVKGA